MWAGERVEYVEARRQTWPSSIAWPGQLSRELSTTSRRQGRALLGEIKTLCEEKPQGEVLDEYTFKRRDLRRVSRSVGDAAPAVSRRTGADELVEPVIGRQGRSTCITWPTNEERPGLSLDCRRKRAVVITRDVHTSRTSRYFAERPRSATARRDSVYPHPLADLGEAYYPHLRKWPEVLVAARTVIVRRGRA